MKSIRAVKSIDSPETHSRKCVFDLPNARYHYTTVATRRSISRGSYPRRREKKWVRIALKFYTLIYEDR